MNLPATTLPAICAIALATTGCAKKLGEPRIATADQAVRTLSAWPQGHTQPLKITDALTLEITTAVRALRDLPRPERDPGTHLAAVGPLGGAVRFLSAGF